MVIAHYSVIVKNIIIIYLCMKFLYHDILPWILFKPPEYQLLPWNNTDSQTPVIYYLLLDIWGQDHNLWSQTWVNRRNCNHLWDVGSDSYSPMPSSWIYTAWAINMTPNSCDVPMMVQLCFQEGNLQNFSHYLAVFGTHKNWRKPGGPEFGFCRTGVTSRKFAKC